MQNGIDSARVNVSGTIVDETVVIETTELLLKSKKTALSVVNTKQS